MRDLDDPTPWRGWLGFTVGSAACFGLAYICDRACVAEAAPPVIVWTRTLSTEPVGYCEAAAPVTVDVVPERLGILLHDLPTQDEREVVVTAIDGCQQTNRRVADPWLALALLRLEADAGAPAGMLLAAWCREASMRTVSASTGGPIHGDVLDGVARAVGPMQMHGWWVRWCGWDRDRRADLLDSATCYLRRIVDQLDEAESECGAGDAAWRVAEALAANAPRYASHGCDARSEHWRILESWR